MPLQDITRKFKENREDVISSVTVRRCLYINNFHRRVVRKNIRIREANVRGRLAWARGKIYWTVERDWSQVICSDESKIIVDENNRVFVWRKPGEEWLPQCLSPDCNAKMSLMIWGCITFNGVGTLTTVNGNINAAKYIEILEDNLWPVIVRHYREENNIFQDDNAPVHSVQIYKTQNKINGMLLKTVGSC